MAVMIGPKLSGCGFPANSFSFGFGSKRSMWLGPPSMNRKITLLACPEVWGGRAVAGDATESLSRYANAKAPKPAPPLVRNSRRENGPTGRCRWARKFSPLLFDIDKLVRIQEHMAIIHQRFASRLLLLFAFQQGSLELYVIALFS